MTYAKDRQKCIEEIRRVAEGLGVHPSKLTRRAFRGIEAEVTTAQIEHWGTWSAMRGEASIGVERDWDTVSERGAQLRTQADRKQKRVEDSTRWLAQRMEESIVRAFTASPVRHSRIAKRWDAIEKVPVQRQLVAVLSDTHYGAMIDPREVPGCALDWTVSARRTALFCEQIETWKPAHRAETELVIAMIGDLIEGAIHVISEGTLVLLTEQVHGATSILFQMIDRLRHAFRKVHVKVTPGNHARYPHRGAGRTTSAKWDSVQHAVLLGLQYAFREADDVSFTIPRTPYVTWDAPGGELMWATHGDTVISPGNVGKSVNTAKLGEKVMQLDASDLYDRPVAAAIFGHVHVPMCTTAANGCDIVVNGTLSGTGPYAQSINIHGNHPCQVLFESVPGNPVGDFRRVKLRLADEDPRYDAIIAPPSLELDQVA